jgi:hypothetical protein
MGYEIRAGAIVDSITLWTNKKGLGTFGGTGGKIKEKKIANPGQTLVDIQIDTCKFKNFIMVQNISNPAWNVVGANSDWTTPW